MLKYSVILFIIFSFCGCIPFINTPPTVLKEVKDENVTVQWLGRSTAYAEVPDIVIAKYGKQVDTLCIAQNITDIMFHDDIFTGTASICIGFLGIPEKYGKPVPVKDKTFGYDVLADKNYHVVFYVNERKIYHGGIINKDVSFHFTFDEQKQRYTTTEEDIAAVEKILRENLDYIKTNQPDYSYSISDNLDNYLRQYAGFINKDGEKVVWVNFLCDDGYINISSLHESILTVLDGGSCFWSVKVNIAKRKLYDMRVNGVA